MADTVLLFIVDRRRPGVFRYLQNRYRDQPNLCVMWDRRIGDRRRASPTVEPDRRRSDRRDSPPDFSTTPGFIVVSQEARASQPEQTEGRTSAQPSE